MQHLETLGILLMLFGAGVLVALFGLLSRHEYEEKVYRKILPKGGNDVLCTYRCVTWELFGCVPIFKSRKMVGYR